MQTLPPSLLQRMTENVERLEIKEKEEKQKKEEIQKRRYDEIVRRQKENEERSKASRAMIEAELARRAKMAAKKARVKAARKAKAKAEEGGVASAKAEEGTERAKANAEEGAQITMAISEEDTGKGKANAEDITRAEAEEVARTIDLAHGALEVKMDSSGGEPLVELKDGEELGKRSEMQVPMKVKEDGEEYQQKEILRKAEEAGVKMSKAKRAKMKALYKMEAMAEKPSWPEAEEVAMTTKARAKEATKIAKSKAEEAAKIAKSKAELPEEAEEAAEITKSKAEEAEEAAKVTKSKADEAAKAKEAADEVRRLKENVTEWAQCEEELFAAKFRSFWNKLYTGLGATFQQTTSIPAMRHTYPESGCSPMAMETLQVMSVKVTSIKECLHWPLQVFGMVAARDVLDHKRNIIFHRPRSNCQTITQDDCYLALTGPSRAIAVSTDPSYIEVSLKVKGAAKSEDKDLSEFVVMFRSGCCLESVYPSRLSTLELEFAHIIHSVEATVCIKIIGGSWPDGFRGAFSAGTSGYEDQQVKLLDSGADGLPIDADGVIKLSRRVVSVELEKNLKVSVMACPIDKGHVAESSEAVLKPQRAGKSPPGIMLSVGSCSMEVTVAWSCFRHEFC